MRVLDLFSGIGGFSLGLERAGMKTICFVEIDPFCQKVLRKHWPEVPIHDDIKTFCGEQGKYDLICGGDPCQPHSLAGLQRGEEDARYLWPEKLRIIQESRCAWVLNENVVGSNTTLALDKKIIDLEGVGYEVAPPLEIPACAVDADHYRPRIFLVAYNHSFRRNLREPEGERVSLHKTRPEVDPRASTNAGCVDVQGCNGENGLWQKTPRRQIAISSCDWGRHYRVPSSRFCRSSDGIPDRVDRTVALGNAIVPQIAEIIGRAIITAQQGLPL